MILPTRKMHFWKPAGKKSSKTEKSLLSALVRERNHNVSHEINYFSNFLFGDVECSFEDHMETFPPVFWNLLARKQKKVWKLQFFQKIISLKTFLWTPKHSFSCPVNKLLPKGRKFSIKVRQKSKTHKLFRRKIFFKKFLPLRKKRRSESQRKSFVRKAKLSAGFQKREIYKLPQRLDFSSQRSSRHVDWLFENPAEKFCQNIENF